MYRSNRKFASKDLIVITGATSGIGLAVTKELAGRNCHLVLGCRNIHAGERIRKQLKKEFGHSILVEVFPIDLSCLESISSFVDQVNRLNKPIYALVNNAGIFYAPPSLTIDQIEQTFQVNYLGHFLVTVLLLPKLKLHQLGARIINLTSKAHQANEYFPDLELHHYFDDSHVNRFRAYQYSKFCLVVFAHKLSSILANTLVTVHCVDPGNVETNIYRHFPQLANKVLFCLQKPIRVLVVKTPREGAQSVLYAILSSPTPQFYICSHYQAKAELNPRVYSPILGDALWTLSRNMCRSHLLEMNYSR